MYIAGGEMGESSEKSVENGVLTLAGSAVGTLGGNHFLVSLRLSGEWEAPECGSLQVLCSSVVSDLPEP